MSFYPSNYSIFARSRLGFSRTYSDSSSSAVSTSSDSSMSPGKNADLGKNAAPIRSPDATKTTNHDGISRDQSCEEVVRFSVTGMAGCTSEHEAESIAQLRTHLAATLGTFRPCVILFAHSDLVHPIQDFADLSSTRYEDGEPSNCPRCLDLYLINADAGMKDEMSAWSGEKWTEVLEDHVSYGDAGAIKRAVPRLGDHVREELGGALQTIITLSRTREYLDKEAARVNMLVRLGVDPGVRGRNGMTMLHCAAELGHMELVLTWLNLSSGSRNSSSSSCQLDATNYSGHTALYLASARGHTQVVHALVGRSADTEGMVRRRTEGGESAVAPAPRHGVTAAECAEQQADMMRIMMANTDGEEQLTPLHVAARAGHADIIRILIQARADVDCGDNGGRTALHVAAAYGHAEAAQALLHEGGNTHLIHTRNPHYLRRTPIHTASLWGHTAVVCVLIGAHANVNVLDADRWTPLHLAASMGRTDAIRVLMDAGADGTIKNEEGNTPLDLAFGEGVNATSCSDSTCLFQ